MSFKRADRVNALLQRELGTIISEELRDPRIGFSTVTAVEITDDLRSARVHVSVLGDEEKIASTMTALEEAKAYLRHEVGSRTDLRYVPELSFVNDRSAEQAARISSLLREAREQEKGS
ncbi:MAG TPA: 30S ribosome-binding factor RbfA [Methylomirabilota bacterium]|jgi:ribosome-binding factor A|nr:30S ribosome-binding factor RbfA [Methylomirabilota bacterium]